MGASGLGCSLRQVGTNTVMELWPLSRKKLTASWIPRHENTSLLPWLKKKEKKKKYNGWLESDNKKADIKGVGNNTTVDLCQHCNPLNVPWRGNLPSSHFTMRWLQMRGGDFCGMHPRICILLPWSWQEHAQAGFGVHPCWTVTCWGKKNTFAGVWVALWQQCNEWWQLQTQTITYVTIITLEVDNTK